MKTLRKGFTLIELMTVLAITAILMGIIIYPMIQSFNLTRAALGYSDAQERARVLLEAISRDIENSVGVRENDGVKGQLAVVLPGQDTTPVLLFLDYAKLDIVKPAQGDPSLVQNGAYYNPDTGRYDPTLHSPKGQITIPTAPGQSVVRYFISLKSPLGPTGTDPGRYNNPYDGLLMKANSQPDNLYVLRRAEVQPMIPDPSSSTPKLIVNTALFDDDGTGKPVMDDPYFMTLSYPGQTPTPTSTELQAKAKRIQHWIDQSRVVTEISRYDMVQPIFDKSSRQVVYDGNVPRVIGLMQFRPTPITDESAVGQTAVRLNEETDNAERIAPDVFRTELGGWSGAVVRVLPSNFDTAQPQNSPHLYALLKAGSKGSAIYLSSAGTSGAQEELYDDAHMLFDIDAFENGVAGARAFPFSRAVDSADKKSNFLSDPAMRDYFVPFFSEVGAGKVYTSFNIQDVGDITATNPSPATNYPVVDTGPTYSPTTDPDASNTGLTFADPLFQSINRKFNKVWFDSPNLRPNIHRFIDLRVQNQPDGTPSPLDPRLNSAKNNQPFGFLNGSIVPGSEVITGPDQLPGPNYGRPVRYMRTTGNPGANQYRINYTDIPEPTKPVSGQYQLAYDDAFGYPNPPAAYTATDFSSAILQPRFKAGYIQLNSDPNVPLPTGNILITYRFQFNKPAETNYPAGASQPVITHGDTFTVDYDSRQAISILLTIRNYPQSSIPNPQSVTLKSIAQVRNFLR